MKKKRHIQLVIVLFALSVMAGYLLSKASWIGRLGMKFFYKEYRFLQVWWKGAAVVFVLLLIVYFLQLLVNKKWQKYTKTASIVNIVIALTGLYFTYADFRQTISHRWMGERFHLGAYCFWLGWLLTGLFFLTARQFKASGKKEITGP